MWDTFLSDTLVTVIGAVLGACLTVGIAYKTFQLQQRHTEKQVLTNLIHDLHHKRALRAITPTRVPNARESPDFDRTTKSVLEMREWIRTARNSLPPRSHASPTLSGMLVACNRHLRRSDRNPDNYQAELMKLRKSLHSGVLEICSKVPHLEPPPPGSGPDQADNNEDDQGRSR